MLVLWGHIQQAHSQDLPKENKKRRGKAWFYISRIKPGENNQIWKSGKLIAPLPSPEGASIPDIVISPKVSICDGCWYLPGQLQDTVHLDLLLDSGCSFSLLPQDVFNKLPISLRPPLSKACSQKVRGFTGEKAKVLGSVTLQFTSGKQLWNVDFLIVDKASLGILGIDFLTANGIAMDHGQGIIHCKQSILCRQCDIVDSPLMIMKSQNLKPRSETKVEAINKSYPPGSTVMVEGTVEDFNGGIAIANTLVTIGTNGACMVRIMNPHDTPMLLQPGTEIGKLSLVKSVETDHPLCPAP